MHRHCKSLAGMLGVALLLGSVAVGCSRRGGADVATPVLPPAATATAIAPADASVSVMTAEPSSLETPSTSDSPAATTAAGANPTTDPLDAQLQGIDQILGGVDTSISGSGNGGGE